MHGKTRPGCANDGPNGTLKNGSEGGWNCPLAHYLFSLCMCACSVFQLLYTAHQRRGTTQNSRDRKWRTINPLADSNHLSHPKHAAHAHTGGHLAKQQTTYTCTTWARSASSEEGKTEKKCGVCEWRESEISRPLPCRIERIENRIWFFGVAFFRRLRLRIFVFFGCCKSKIWKILSSFSLECG